MKIFNFLMLIIFHYVNLKYKILQPEEFYSTVQIRKGSSFYKEIITNLKILIQYFVYINIAKNPPQPSFDTEYFPKIDTLSYLDNLYSNITEDTNNYDFFRKLRFLVDTYKDAHMSYGIKGFNYFSYVFLSPIKLITKIDNSGNPYMTAVTNPITSYEYFRDGEHVFMVINQNKDIKVESINGENPFDFIQNFGGKFFNLKNKHASYSVKFKDYLSSFVMYYPLMIEDIQNFTVVYSNGDYFETDYAIAEIVNEDIKNDNLYSFFDDEENEHNFMIYYNNIINNSNDHKNLYEILSDYKRKLKNNINIRNLKEENNNNYNNLKEIKWNYEYLQNGIPLLQCRIDIINKFNIFHLKSYDYSDYDTALQTLINCTKLTDTNTFPIIIIQDFNGGGVEFFGNTMAEFIQPHMSTKFYTSLLMGDYLNEYYDIKNGTYFTIGSCEIPDKNKFINDSIEINYNNVINKISIPYLRFGQNKTFWENFRKTIKNPRKPTNIIVFTDSYSASTTSLFCKTLQNEGGAILVGYNGNPILNESDYPFDSSQHFSSVIFWQDLQILNPEVTKKLDELGIKFSQMCIANNYLDINNLKVPEEYNIREVDERVKIYQNYDDNIYDIFISEAQKIFTKYNSENKCNKKNKKLVKFSDECKFENKYTHGGYACDDNGKWSRSNCIATYCDIGYYMNYTSRKCLEDPCSIEKHGKGRYISKFSIYLFFIVIIIMF